MSVGCTISESQFLHAYELTNAAIKAKLGKQSIFDTVEYMKYFYKEVKNSQLKGGLNNQDASERAAQWLAELPSIMDKVILNNFSKNMAQIENLGEMYKLRAEFNEDNVPLSQIVNYFEAKIRIDVEAQNQNNFNAAGGGPTVINSGTSKFDDGTPRLTAQKILTTTLPIFKPKKNKDDLVDEVDEERVTINTTLSKIVERLNNENAVTEAFKYQGSKLMLKAVNADTFTNPETEEGKRNLGKLDSTTQIDFQRSRQKIAEGTARTTVTQINQRVLLVVTDENGNPISFDKDGNITAAPTGKYVFQFLRDIKKEGNSYQIKDIYGIEDRVNINSVIAARVKNDKSKTKQQHENDVQTELTYYYKLKEAALKEDVLVDIVGITQGLDKRMKQQRHSLSKLISLKKITPQSLAGIRTFDEDTAGFEKGFTAITIDGEYYLLDRQRMPNDIADQIVASLFSKKFDLKTKEKFYSQFIPENYTPAKGKKKIRLSYSMRRHKFIMAKDSLKIQIYSKVGRKDDIGWTTVNGQTENLLYQLMINNAGEVFQKQESGYVKLEDTTAMENALASALKMAYVPPMEGATFIHYPYDLLEKPDSFQLYDIEKKTFYNDNYHDFILNAEVIFAPETNAAFNQQLIFKIPTKASKFFQQEEPPIIKKPAEEPESDSEESIIQSIEPTVETKGNITFGTAGAVGENKNQDAVYVDTENGIYILADGMGGMNAVPSQFPEQASSDLVNMLKGTPVKTRTQLLYEEFQKNPKITAEEVMDFLGLNKNSPTAYIVIQRINNLLLAFQGVNFDKKSNEKGYKSVTTGAVSAVAKKVARNKYKIEKVGDTVFFVVDKNGKVIKSHGLSTTATVDEAYMFYVRDGKPQMNSPKVDKFTVELKDGQTLVLATDFIETEKAMNDFIKTDFGKNIDFAKFQKENKNDDSTFIVIREESADTSADIKAQIEDIERRREELLKEVLYEKNGREEEDLNEPYYVTYDLSRDKQKQGLLGKVETIKADTYEEIQNKINDLFDEELVNLNIQDDVLIDLLNETELEYYKTTFGDEKAELYFTGAEQVPDQYEDELKSMLLTIVKLYPKTNFGETPVENTPKNNAEQVNSVNSQVDTSKGIVKGGAEGLDEGSISGLDFDRSGKLSGEVSPEEIRKAELWWKNSLFAKELKKHISLNQVTNIVNSDAYANFVVNMTRLANPETLGTINLTTKGSMVDLYHEAFHGFTQLFMTISQKRALYEEVMNMKDSKGNTPFALYSARQIEEVLAEDFRTYVKNGGKNIKKGRPVRNTLFRRFLNFIKSLLGIKISAPPIEKAQLDVLSIPQVKELFDNLGGFTKKADQKKFLNKYQASIDNARFFYLERGPQFVEKLGKEKNKRQSLTVQDGKLGVESMDSIISSIIDRIYGIQTGQQEKISKAIAEKEQVLKTLQGDDRKALQEEIDELKTKQVIPTNLRGTSLSMLLNAKNRSKLYTWVKQALVERHAEIAAEWKESTDSDLTISSQPKEGETEIEALRRKSVAVLEKGEDGDGKVGGKKYILLRSQIDSFDQLNPNLKEERVKGEKYYGISITGDYFVHKTLRNPEGEGGFAEIIVVSDVNDAKKQYDNYKKAGAKYKTITVDQWSNIYQKVEDRKPKNLTSKQEVIFNNLRILSAMIDQYGDPSYLEKGIAPTGMIAYHILNSDFEIGRLKYFAKQKDTTEESDKDELIDTDVLPSLEDLEAVDGSLEAIDPEMFDNKKSLLELADKEVVYILKSLHEVKVDKKGKPVMTKNKDGVEEITYLENTLGFRRRANFRKVWNTVSKTIGGVQSRAKAFELLRKEAENYPELKQLIENKLPSPEGIKNSYAYSISSSFWKTFSRPKADFYQLSIYKNYNDKNEIESVDFSVVESTADIRKVMLQFESYFKMGLSKYVNISDQGTALLDTRKLLAEIPKLNTVSTYRNFLYALGIRMDNTDRINEIIKNDQKFIKSANELYEFAESMLQLKLAKEKTKEQIKLLRLFESNPVRLIKGKNRLITDPTIIPGYSKITSLRIDSSLKYITEIQSKFGFDTPGETKKLPDGNKAYSIINHMSLTSLVYGINDLEKLTDAWNSVDFQDWLGHLNPSKNFFTNRSKLIASLFNERGERKRKTNRKLDIITIAGSEIIDNKTGDEQGLNTADLTAIDKFFQELNMSLTKGIVEFARHAEKKLAYALLPNEKVNVINPETGEQAKNPKVNSNLWIDIEKFDDDTGESIALNGFLLDYLAAEFDRIRFFANNEEVLLTTEGYNEPIKKYEDKAKTRKSRAEIVKKAFKEGNLSGQNFAFMDDLLTPEIQNKLKKLANQEGFTEDIVDHIRNNPAELLVPITNSIKEYFDTKVGKMIDNYLSKVPHLANDALFGFRTNDEYTGTRTETSVMKAYVYNDWISKFEMFNLINGDGAQFNHAKEAATKRIPGSTSNGDGFLSDVYSQNFINDSFNVDTYSTRQFGEEYKLRFDGSLNTAVVDDPVRISDYIVDMEQAWREDYSKTKMSEDLVDELVKKDLAPYREMQEADGAAFLTLDSYRMLKKLGSEWSIPQENLYKKIINGEKVSAKDASEFFPVYKLHYYGPIVNSAIAATAMYKFAVAPIIPSIATSRSQLFDLHKKMIMDDINMVVMSSGSKAAIMTEEQGMFDNIFTETDRNEYRTVNPNAKLRNNKLHLKYFKDVTKVGTTLKDLITLGTQDRVISIDSLFDMGKYIEGKEGIGKEYFAAVNNLTQVYQDELLAKIGFKFNPKTGKFTGNIVDLIDVIKRDLELKGISEQLISMLDVNLSDKLKHDFSIIPVADVIEKIIVTKISKAIVNQKTKGESMVQVPSTFYNGLWDVIEAEGGKITRQEKSYLKNNENIKKYLGSNNLPYYLRGEVINKKTGKRAKTNLAKVAIPLAGDFVNLLNLKYEGEVIGTIDRLNELIKEDAFLEKHRDKLTIVGPRIPTDAINLKEAFEVWHFIDASAGNTVIVPTEIVAKAGSDFDIDKIFFSFPNIEKNGELTKPVVDYEKKLERLRKKNFSTLGLVRQQKRFAQNEWVRTTANIIKDPSNYGPLTKPTSSYLLEDKVRKFYDNLSTTYNPLSENVHSTRDGMSPTRVMEAEYNLNKHKEMLGGNRPLGILAKKRKQHTLYKSIGAKFPLNFVFTPNERNVGNLYKSGIKRDFVLNFESNKTEDGNISLSSNENVDGENIGNIISHYLQSILDRSNNPFASRGNITKEALPVLLRLIESGVSKDIALAFVNQPLIQNYLFKKAENSGFIKKSLQGSRESDIFNSYQDTFDEDLIKEYGKALEFSNRERIIEILNDFRNNNPKTKFKVTFTVYDNATKSSSKKVKIFQNYKQFDGSEISQNINKINNIQIEVPFGVTKRFVEVYKNNFNPKDKGISFGAMKYQNYYISQYLWKKAFGNKKITADLLEGYVKNGDLSTIQQLALMAHFFQIEYQSNGMLQLEQNFNPDTAGVDTLVGVSNRKMFIDSLASNTKIDPETRQRLIERSIISSLYKTDIYQDIAEPLFDLRLHPKITEYISQAMIDSNDKITKKYGFKEREKGRFVDAFNNTLVDFIYQNTLSNFTDNNQLPIELPEEIDGIKIERFKGTLRENIKVEKGKIKVDLDFLKRVWAGKFYLDTSKGQFSFGIKGLDTFSQKENPFSTFDSFARYMLEKEILYMKYDVKDFASNKAYETFISKQALINTNNSAYIRGTTKYSYTKDVLNIIKNNPELMDFYPVLRQLGESFLGRSVYDENNVGGLSLLELRDKQIIDSETANVYYQNIKDLGNKDITKKSTGAKANTSDEISEVFKNFSMMMFYQQGVGRSQLSFSNILDGEQFARFMNRSVNTFMSKIFTEKNQDNLLELLNFIKDTVLEGKGFKNYIKPYEVFLGKNITDLLPVNTGIKSLDDIASEYNAARLKGDPALAIQKISEYGQLKSALQRVQEEEGEVPAPIVETGSKMQQLYDRLPESKKKKLGMTVEELQQDFNDYKALAENFTEEKYMEEKTCNL